MNSRHLISLTTLAVLLTSCGSNSLSSSLSRLNAPLEGGFNPLDPPGLRRLKAQRVETGVLFAEGTVLETLQPSSPLFREVPKGGDQPFAVLAQGIVLQTLGSDGSYVKVQTESGQVGYIPDAMVAPQALLTGSEQELLAADLTLNPDGVPLVAPEPEIPSIEPPVSVGALQGASSAAPLSPALDTIVPPIAPSIEAPAPELTPPSGENSSGRSPSIAPEPELPSIE